MFFVKFAEVAVQSVVHKNMVVDGIKFQMCDDMVKKKKYIYIYIRK